MIVKSTLPEADLIIGGNWTDLNEDKYAEISTEQHANAGKAAESGMTVDTMANAVGESMKGESATASAAVSEKRSANMSAQQATHSNRALGTGLVSQAIANFKTSVNATVAKYNTAWEATKAQAVANEWPQQKITEEKEKLVTEHQNEVSVLKNDFDATNESLEASIAAGEEPTVPKTMPTPPAGEAAPQTGVPPEIGQQMSQMLGGLGQMAQHTPGSDVINPAVQSLTQALGGAGGSGDVPLTADALDTLLAGQSDGGDMGSGTLVSDVSPADDAGTDASDSKEDASHTVTASQYDFSKDEKPSPAATPVSAAPPASSTVPTTHLSGDPSTPVVTDAANAPAAPVGGGGGVPSAPSSSYSGDTVSSQSSGNPAPGPSHSGIGGVSPGPAQPLMSDTGMGTELSGSSGSAVASSSALGAPTLGAPSAGMVGGMGGGVPVGGMGGGIGGGLGGGMPMAGGGVGAAPSFPASMAPAAPAAGSMAAAVAPAPPAAPPMTMPATTPHAAPHAAPVPGAPSAVSVPRPEAMPAPGAAHDGQRAGGMGLPMAAMPFPSSATETPDHGSVYHPSSPFTSEDRQAATVVHSLIESFMRGGMFTPVAVALLENGTAVFCTSDGLGYIPRGTRLPEGVVPLSEYTKVNDKFRIDMTGSLRPGDVLKLAASLDIILPPSTIISTGSDVESGVTRVSLDMLSGAPRLETPIARDMFGRISAEDVPLALEAFKQMWGIGDVDEGDLDDAVFALSESRWEKVDNPAAVTGLVRYMLTDAQACVQEGMTSEAAYVLKQVFALGDVTP